MIPCGSRSDMMNDLHKEMHKEGAPVGTIISAIDLKFIIYTLLQFIVDLCYLKF
jgi:hypothetical protein